MPRSPAAQALACIALIAGVAGSAALLRILSVDESLSRRALRLVLTAAEGGALAAAAPAFVLSRMTRGSRILRGSAGGAAAGLAFVPAALACFAVKIRILDGRIEGDLSERVASGDIVFSLIGAMGMFTPTGLRYLAPWPLAAVALAAALLFSRFPRPLPESR